MFWNGVRALTRIRAGESLVRIREVAVGTGHMRQDQSQQWQGELRALASGESPGKREGGGRSGKDALAVLKAANETARASGMLWEQRLERGEVKPIGPSEVPDRDAGDGT